MDDLKLVAIEILGDDGIHAKNQNLNMGRVKKLVNYMSGLNRSSEWCRKNVKLVRSSGGSSPGRSYGSSFANLGASHNMMLWATQVAESEILTEFCNEILLQIPRFKSYENVQSFPVPIDLVKRLAEEMQCEELVKLLNK